MIKIIYLILLILYFIYFIIFFFFSYNKITNLDVFIFFKFNEQKNMYNSHTYHYCKFIKKYDRTILYNMKQLEYINLLLKLRTHDYFMLGDIEEFEKNKCVYKVNKNKRIKLNNKNIFKKFENINITKDIKNELINYATIYKLNTKEKIIVFKIYEKIKNIDFSFSESEIKFLFLFLKSKTFSKKYYNLIYFYKTLNDIYFLHNTLNENKDMIGKWIGDVYYEKILIKSFIFLFIKNENKNNDKILIEILIFLTHTYNENIDSNQNLKYYKEIVFNKFIKEINKKIYIKKNDILLKKYLNFLKAYKGFNNIYDLFLTYVKSFEKILSIDIDILLDFFYILNIQIYQPWHIKYYVDIYDSIGLFIKLLSLEKIQKNNILLCEIFYFISKKFEKRYKIYLKYNFLNNNNNNKIFNYNSHKCYNQDITYYINEIKTNE